MMFTLEVLLTCSMYPKSQLFSIMGIDSSKSNIISFDMDLSEPHLSHHLVFQIHVLLKEKNIFHMVLNKGDTTCVMFMSCWKSLGSPMLTPSPTILKAFDGHPFQTYGIPTAFPIELGDKTIPV